MDQTYIGAPIRRREDFRLLTGKATFTDDIKLPQMLHAAILRSPHAHARITSIDAARALAHPWRRRRLHLSGHRPFGQTDSGQIIPIAGSGAVSAISPGAGQSPLRGRAGGGRRGRKPLPGRGRAGCDGRHL